MTLRTPRRPVWGWMSPSAERLFSKMTNLETSLDAFEKSPLTDEQKRVAETCKIYLATARSHFEQSTFSLKPPFLNSKHPHLVWEMLHRVDEQFFLLMTPEEFAGRAVEVKIAFDLNITEEKTRADWIGAHGRLIAVIDKVKTVNATATDRATVKEALYLVNEQMDRNFWQLSADTLTSVWSAVILGLLIVVGWRIHTCNDFQSLAEGGLEQHYKTLVVLGLMGAYVSNVLTKEDFLYVRGGPFLRYWLLHLLGKPLIGAFAALFVFALEKSKLLFAIVISPAGSGSGANSQPLPQFITITADEASVGYVYAVLAIASGFGADKLLRSTFDSVLKRLEHKADKTKDSKDK